MLRLLYSSFIHHVACFVTPYKIAKELSVFMAISVGTASSTMAATLAAEQKVLMVRPEWVSLPRFADERATC